MRAQILLEFNVAPRSRNRGAIENQHGALLQTDDHRRRLNASWRVLFARSCCTRARVSGARALSSSEQQHRARAALRGAGKARKRRGASPDACQSHGQRQPARWHRVRWRRGLRLRWRLAARMTAAAMADIHPRRCTSWLVQGTRFQSRRLLTLGRLPAATGSRPEPGLMLRAARSCLY